MHNTLIPSNFSLNFLFSSMDELLYVNQILCPCTEQRQHHQPTVNESQRLITTLWPPETSIYIDGLPSVDK